MLRPIHRFLPIYRFSNKGFKNFKRDKNSTNRKQQGNLQGDKQKLNTNIDSNHIKDNVNKSPDNVKGFSRFQQKGKKPFNKELFEQMKKAAEARLMQKQQQHLERPVPKNKPEEQNIQKKDIYSQGDQGQSGKEQAGKASSQRLSAFKIPKSKIYLLLLASGLSFISAIYFVYKIFFYNSIPSSIIYSELVQMIKNKQVKQIIFMSDIVRPGQIHVIAKTNQEQYICKVEDGSLVSTQVLQYNTHNTPSIHMRIQTNHNMYFDRSRIKDTLMLFVNLGLMWVFFKSMGSLRVPAGNSKGSPKNLFQLEESYGREKKMRKTVSTKFKDVAGMETPKKQIFEFVQFLKHPERFRRLGARIPRGALLTGPPGTGKTLLAKACAGEAKVSFFSASGSEFVQKFVGVGAARVRQLFKQAKASAPSIIFIDEIDAVGRKRWKHAIGGNDEKDSTLNQLLVEMDGFGTQEDVVVFAATNRKQMLDDALLRPGRFDRIIQIQLPDLQQRYEMFLVHLNPIRLSHQTSNVRNVAQRMAMLTPGFSGADIFNVCNEAAILTARDNRDHVTMKDFQNACDRIVAGTVKRNTLSEQERKTVAYHEAGHGVVSWFLEGANPLLKLTIVPRSKGSLGFAQYLPSDKKIFTKESMVDQLAVVLGGRVSEMEFFGKLTTGAADDFQRASKMAYQMIKQYGMGGSLFNKSSSQTEYMKEFSQYTGAKIDKEVRDLVSQALNRAKQLVKLHRQKIQKLAQLLLTQPTIDSAQIQQILGVRPFNQSLAYKNFISKV